MTVQEQVCKDLKCSESFQVRSMQRFYSRQWQMTVQAEALQAHSGSVTKNLFLKVWSDVHSPVMKLASD